MQSSFFFGVSTIAYFLAMMTYITYLGFKKKPIGIVATSITIVGFVSQTIALVLRWKEFYAIEHNILRSIPLTNLYESLIFFVWCLILAYLVIEFKYNNRSFGAFITPVAGLALAFIDLSGMSKSIEPLVPALQSNWLLAHVMMSFISYAMFGISFSTGLMYLIVRTEKRNEPAYIFWTVMLSVFVIVLAAMGLDFLTFKVAAGQTQQEFLKSYLFKATFRSSSGAVEAASWIGSAVFAFLVWRYGGIMKKAIKGFNLSAEMLDEITYKMIAIGFPIFTLGGLIFGALWANQAWGKYWGWDPKETWSLITWFIYAFYLHSRLMRGWRGRKVAIVAVVGFIAVIFTYLGVNLLLSGLHSYGSQ